MRPLRVAHVIVGLGAGGAEMMLFKLVRATHGDGARHVVASMIGDGPVGAMLASAGVEVISLGMRQGVPDPLALPRLVRWLMRERPDVVHGWMYQANLLAGLAAVAAGRIPVVWGIHHTDVDPASVKRLTQWTRALCARLSGVLPARIVCCADSALRSHAAIGYRADRMEVIPNGFDLQRFAPSAVARARIREELSIPEGAPVVGLVARFHRDKDHANFLAAAELVARASPHAVFVLAGRGVDWNNPSLAAGIGEHLRTRVRLLGLRRDVPELLAALDVLASSSMTEGFPNVLGEAMASGVPCAATDCGDSREIVGTAGRTVPPRDPTALAAAILGLLELPPDVRAQLGRAAREHIRARYEIGTVARRYLNVYMRACSVRRPLAGERPAA